YDKQTMAGDVRGLAGSLGFERVALVGHDLGAMVAYAYARSYPSEVSHLVVTGAALPGFGLERLADPPAGPGLPHLTSFARPGAAERLAGHERAFLARFIRTPEVVNSDAFEAYLNAYSRPGRLDAALGQYRALGRDAADNRRAVPPLLTVPVLAVGADPASVELTAGSMRRVARMVATAELPGGGHYVPETRPAELGAAVLAAIG
ncbi:MAG: alpha/beta hydrolase, partial [Actinobacteria bacterium]|nr:alpha/beta hydrolase [Actinomycetota bacterium]